MIPPSTYLTPREREVLDLVARGLTFADVADRLIISSYTVASHIRNVRQKLHATNCVNAIFILYSDGPTNGTTVG